MEERNYIYADRKPKINIIEEILTAIGMAALIAIILFLLSLAAL